MRKYDNLQGIDTTDTDPIIARLTVQTFEKDVWVPAVQNFLGAAGIAIVVVAIQMWRMHYGHSKWHVEDLFAFSGLSAGVVFGVSSAVRAFRDEIQLLVHSWATGWAIGRTDNELSWSRQRIQHLESELQQLRAQTAQMSKYVQYVPTETPPSSDAYTHALNDAIALCRHHAMAKTIARDKAMSTMNITKSRWETSRQLLLDAGVPVNSGVIAVPEAQAIQMVRKFVDRQRNAPAGFVIPQAKTPSVQSADRTGQR